MVVQTLECCDRALIAPEFVDCRIAVVPLALLDQVAVCPLHFFRAALERSGHQQQVQTDQYTAAARSKVKKACQVFDPYSTGCIDIDKFRSLLLKCELHRDSAA
jgi:hypothetical protein